MMELWVKIQRYAIEAALFIIAHWQIAAVVAGFILVALIFGWIQSCNANRGEKKIQEIRTNVTTGKVESNLAANAVNAAANVSNKTLENVNKAKNQNINGVSNSYDDARRRYCEAFPNDCL